MAKKINYKLPSMVALTLFGTAFTAHHADAAEATQDQTKNKNVLDDQTTLKQANNAKKEVSNPTQNISGTQTYQDPTKVKPVQTTSTESNDTSKQNDSADVTNITNTTSDSTNSDKESKQNDTNTQKDVSTGANDNQSTTNVDSDKSTNANNEAVKEQTDNNTNAQAQQQTQNTENNVENKTSQETSQNENTESTKQTVKNNGGYSLTDDEDDVENNTESINNSNDTNEATATTTKPSENNKTDKQVVSKQTVNSSNNNTNETNTKNVSNESAKVESSQVNTGSNNQVSTFSSVAKPRMMYAAAKSTTSSLPKYKPAVKSSINDYIRKKNFKAPQIEEDYSSYFPKYGYRNGVGKPEGIVVHDTANENSTITGEINYMKNNYNSAFVHAFVDGNRIIETAPTDYLSWGAGPYGNERYINVEIVHTHDYDSFARSMNNYADYAATQLQYYGLKPDSAENDGKGTVWTHAAISRWLGGTDHADPHSYFQQHNYSYNELYDLINEKYQIKMGQVAPWGTTSTSTSTTTKPSSGSTTTKPSTSNSKLTVAANSGMAQINTKNSGLYTTVYDKKGHSTKEVQKALSVTKTATLGNDKFYLVQDYNTGEKFGWVKQNEVIYNTAKSPVKVNQSYNVKSGTKAYTVPWGTSKQVAGTVSGKGNQTFKATKQQQIDKATYLYGTVNGLTGWISKAYLATPTTTTKPVTKPTTKPSTTNSKLTVAANNGVAQINSKNSGLYTTVYDKSGKTTKEVQKTLAVSKTATLGNDKFYLVQDYNTGKTYGWVKQSDVVYNTAKSPTSVNHSYSVKPGTKAYTVPWGTYKQEAGTVSGNGNQTFKATKQQQIDKATYLYGTVNGITGWISKYYLSEPTSTKTTVAKPKMAFKSYAVTNKETPKTQTTTKPKNTQTTTKTNSTQTTKKIGQVKLNNSGIRSSVYDKTAKSGAKYANRTFTISKQRTEGNQTYVLLQNTVSNTPLGWVNINDINVQNLGNETKETGKYQQ